MKLSLKQSLLLAIGLQLAILLGVYTQAVWPYWFGQQIKVTTVPVDPRSLFRGNYALLGYEFSRIDFMQIDKDHELRKGDRLFVTLEQQADSLYRLASVSRTPPESGLFIAGRVERYVYRQGERTGVFLRYGIEAFFAPKEKALSLERGLADGGVATLTVAKNGQVRLLSVE